MAERIVSPGVFTRERDLSFLPAGIGEIGAAIIGPTISGPSFVPTVVTSFADFQIKFGSYSTDFYTPFAGLVLLVVTKLIPLTLYQMVMFLELLHHLRKTYQA